MASDTLESGRSRPRSIASFRMPKLSLADGWVAAAVGVVAFTLAAWRAGNPSLWFDEAFSVGLASQPLAVMWQYLWGSQGHMALYFGLLHEWLNLLTALNAPHSEFLLRLPSVIAAALAAIVVYRIGAQWWGRSTGLTAAVAFACNPLLLRQAQEVRSYTLQALLQALAWYCFLAAIDAARAPGELGNRAQSRRWWAMFAGACELAVYAHIDTVVCLAAFPLALLALAFGPDQAWREGARRSAIPLAVSLAAVGALAAPLGYDAVLHGGGNGWVPAASLTGLVSMTRENLLAGVGWMIWPLLVFVALALLPTGWLRVVEAPTFAAFAWFVAPLALFWVIPHLFLWRYLTVLIAPLSLLIGIGAGRLKPQALRIGAILALTLLLARLPLAYYAETRDDYRTAATWLNTRIQPGDGAICWPDVYCAIPMMYYTPELANASYPGGWNWVDSVHAGPNQVTMYVAGKKRVWLILAPHGGVVPGQEAAVRASLVAAGFTPTEHIYTPAVNIFLYVRR